MRNSTSNSTDVGTEIRNFVRLRHSDSQREIADALENERENGNLPESSNQRRTGHRRSNVARRRHSRRNVDALQRFEDSLRGK